MGDPLPWDNGYGDTKGWDRPSIARVSRAPYVPNISAKDLRLPNEAGPLRAVALCFICAVAMTFLYVGIPLYLVAILVSLPAWAAAVPAAALLGLTIFLFVASLRETRALRTLAKEL